MCLGIPGQLITINEIAAHDSVCPEHLLRTGLVRFGGITKDVNLAYTPDAKLGDYVIVHVGFAISCLDEAEAIRILETLEHLSQPEEP